MSLEVFKRVSMYLDSVLMRSEVYGQCLTCLSRPPVSFVAPPGVVGRAPGSRWSCLEFACLVLFRIQVFVFKKGLE